MAYRDRYNRVYCGSRPRYESLTVGTGGATVVEGQSRSGGQVPHFIE